MNPAPLATGRRLADTECMAKRPRDLNQLAKLVVDIASGEVDDPVSVKMRNSVAPRGQAGGIKGGKARAGILSAEQRTDIAKNAAQARWTNKRQQEHGGPDD